MSYIKFFAVILVIAIIVDLVLFITGKVSPLWFWVIVIFVAFIAYRILPKIKEKKV